MTDNEGRRNPRLRLACARCQRRKIKCDGQYPTCGNCRKAATDCVDGDSIRLRNGPQDRRADRAVITRLRKRNMKLEAIIRERLPDVDLFTEPSPEPSFLDINEDDGSTEDHESSSRRARSETSVVNRAELAAFPGQRAHEIGLISVGFNADQRYIGPSSGYFLARLLLSNSQWDTETEQNQHRRNVNTQASINELVSAIHGPLPLPPQALAMKLCQLYFETVQPQFPILPEPTFRAALNRIYNADDTDNFLHQESAFTQFQIHMVLAIAASIWTWRTKRQVPAESYCLSALQLLDRITVGASFQGLQCMVLLLIFTIHCPSMKLNVWYLNYQCLASVLDLGLQRQVTTSLGVSVLDQEMRTRTFWSVFTIDRSIATMMGRPIGLRDEACDLRLPQLLSDDDIVQALGASQDPKSSIEISVHLFKLSKLNSEVKYVANSIIRDTPSYAYPAIPDVVAWQMDMLQRLDDWAESIPETDNKYIKTTSELRYHSIRMLLLRPSPAIPAPSTNALGTCHASAHRSIRLYFRLYNQDLLSYDWITLHGVVLSLVTLLYCTRALSGVARAVEFEDLMGDISVGLSVLSAAGEYWSGIKRARDVLHELATSTMRWLKQSRQRETPTAVPTDRVSLTSLSPCNTGFIDPHNRIAMDEPFDLELPNLAPGSQLDLNLFPEFYQHQGLFGDTANLDDIMRNLFDDFIPRPDTLF